MHMQDIQKTNVLHCFKFPYLPFQPNNQRNHHAINNKNIKQEDRMMQLVEHNIEKNATNEQIEKLKSMFTVSFRV